MSTKKGDSKLIRNTWNYHSAADARLVFQKWAECSTARRAAALRAMGRVATAAPSSLEGRFSDDSKKGLLTTGPSHLFLLQWLPALPSSSGLTLVQLFPHKNQQLCSSCSYQREIVLETVKRDM